MVEERKTKKSSLVISVLFIVMTVMIAIIIVTQNTGLDTRSDASGLGNQIIDKILNKKNLDSLP